jgi:hypothetical protein
MRKLELLECKNTPSGNPGANPRFPFFTFYLNLRQKKTGKNRKKFVTSACGSNFKIA